MTDLFPNALSAPLAGVERVLIAGAGGGFDVYCGLPLFFARARRRVDVHLANLSLTRLPSSRQDRPVRISADADGPQAYFPERWLAEWLRTQSIEQPVYAFHRTGVRPLAAAYASLVAELNLDCIILVDGGTDSLMRGDEVGLGTPEEDLASLAAVVEQNVATKLLVSVGFGVDAFHGVCHVQFLEAVAGLNEEGGYLGAFALVKQSPHVRRYLEAIDFACQRGPATASIVNTSIASSIEGRYGDHHRSVRTSGSQLWINPLMSLCWCFDLAAVARRSYLLPAVSATETHIDMTIAIEGARSRMERIKRWQEFPV